MTDIPILDRQGALERLGDDEELYVEVLEIFIDDAPNQFASITAALDGGDRETATRAAHSLKGAAANIGAEAMRAVALLMEEAGREGDLGKVLELFPTLQQKFDEVKAAAAS